MSGDDRRDWKPQPHQGGDECRDAAKRDLESAAYWARVCAALPPMTAEEIADIAVILRRIDERRNGHHPPQEPKR